MYRTELLLLPLQIEPATLSNIDFRAPTKKRKDETSKVVVTDKVIAPSSYTPTISKETINRLLLSSLLFQAMYVLSALLVRFK